MNSHVLITTLSHGIHSGDFILAGKQAQSGDSHSWLNSSTEFILSRDMADSFQSRNVLVNATKCVGSSLGDARPVDLDMESKKFPIRSFVSRFNLEIINKRFYYLFFSLILEVEEEN